MKRDLLNQAACYSVRRLTCASLLPGLVFGIVVAVNFAYAGQTTAANRVIIAFSERVWQYVKMRDKLEGQLPKLSDESKPEQIEAHFVTLQGHIIAARASAKPGDIFTPDIADHLRRVIRQEFKGQRLRKLRENVREAETKGVPLRVNVPYPEVKELIEMPPTLLLKLPALPKQLQYHFVNRSLVLIDKEARLIVDYLPNAVP